MSDDDADNAIEARLGGRDGVKYFVWVLPVIAIAISGWLVYRAMPSSSHTVTLYAEDATNIKSNSTQVFYRGVNIGEVTKVNLTKDLARVEMKVRLDEHMQGFARTGARFWLVKPELQGAQLSGLSTIVSGPEIHAEPGQGETKLTFDLSKPPLPGAADSNLRISLQMLRKGTLGRGSKVLFRDVEVGLIESVELNTPANALIAEVQIFERFAHLVRENTVFWNSGGLSVDFGIFSGAEVRASSVQSLLAGSVSFATPENPAAPVATGHLFVLEESPKNDGVKWQPALSSED